MVQQLSRGGAPAAVAGDLYAAAEGIPGTGAGAAGTIARGNLRGLIGSLLTGGFLAQRGVPPTVEIGGVVEQ